MTSDVWRQSARSPQLGFLRVPDFIQLGKFHVAQPLSLRAQFVFQRVEASHEFVRRSLQQSLRVQVTLARQIDDREKQIADLLRRFLLARRQRSLPSSR